LISNAGFFTQLKKHLVYIVRVDKQCWFLYSIEEATKKPCGSESFVLLTRWKRMLGLWAE
jgi:hypothetical protein